MNTDYFSEIEYLSTTEIIADVVKKYQSGGLLPDCTLDIDTLKEYYTTGSMKKCHLTLGTYIRNHYHLWNLHPDTIAYRLEPNDSSIKHPLNHSMHIMQEVCKVLFGYDDLSVLIKLKLALNKVPHLVILEDTTNKAITVPRLVPKTILNSSCEELCEAFANISQVQFYSAEQLIHNDNKILSYNILTLRHYTPELEHYEDPI